MTMMTENYCNDCDEVLNAVVDVDDFCDFKVGRIRCKNGEYMKELAKKFLDKLNHI